MHAHSLCLKASWLLLLLLQDVPALAFSLDSYQARSTEQYAAAARYCVTLIKVLLALPLTVMPLLLLALGSGAPAAAAAVAASPHCCRVKSPSASCLQAALGVLPGAVPTPLRSLAGFVVNVNVPGPSGSAPTSPRGRDDIRGYYLARQGAHCSFPHFVELEVGGPGCMMPLWGDRLGWTGLD